MAKTVQQDGEKERFGEPESAVAETRGGPGPDDRSGEKAEADKAEVGRLSETFFADFGRSGPQGVVEAVGHISEIAGNEGGVEGEALDAAIDGDLKGRYERSNEGKRHVREGQRKPADEKESDGLGGESDAENGAFAEPSAHVFGGGNTGEETDKGSEVGDDRGPIAADNGDTEEDDVAGHGVGEDVTVVEVDDGVQHAPGSGQKHGSDKGIALILRTLRIGGRHWLGFSLRV
jgi:hypothetical protein